MSHWCLFKHCSPTWHLPHISGKWQRLFLEGPAASRWFPPKAVATCGTDELQASVRSRPHTGMETIWRSGLCKHCSSWRAEQVPLILVMSLNGKVPGPTTWCAAPRDCSCFSCTSVCWTSKKKTLYRSPWETFTSVTPPHVWPSSHREDQKPAKYLCLFRDRTAITPPNNYFEDNKKVVFLPLPLQELTLCVHIHIFWS